MRGSAPSRTSSGKAVAARFGRNVRALRLAKGLTLREMADVIGLDKSTLSAVENGLSMPDPRRLPLFALRLGVTIDELFWGAEP